MLNLFRSLQYPDSEWSRSSLQGLSCERSFSGLHPLRPANRERILAMSDVSLSRSHRSGAPQGAVFRFQEPRQPSRPSSVKTGMRLDGRPLNKGFRTVSLLAGSCFVKLQRTVTPEDHHALFSIQSCVQQSSHGRFDPGKNVLEAEPEEQNHYMLDKTGDTGNHSLHQLEKHAALPRQEPCVSSCQVLTGEWGKCI